MTEEQDAYMAKDGESLRAARVLLESDAVEASLNRAYYAMFYTAQAVLRSVAEAPKTHSGTYSRLSFHFVRTGRLPVATARLLADGLDARLRADYDAISIFDISAATDALADAEAFVAAVRPLVHAP